MDSKRKNLLAGSGVALLFGTSFLASKTALNVFDKNAVLAWRFVIAAAILWILTWMRIIRIQLRGKPWYRLLAISIVYPILSYTFEMKGVSLSPSSQAGVIVSLMPVFTMIMGTVFLGEHPGKMQTVMALLSVAGVLVITLCSGNMDMNGNVIGIMCLLFSTSCGAGQAVLVRSQRKDFTTMEMTVVMNTVGAIFFLLKMFCIYHGKTIDLLLGPLTYIQGWFPVLYLGAGCSIGAMFCLNYINVHMPVAQAAVYNNLSTIVSVLAGVFIGHELINAGELTGIIMILVGVWGVNRFAKNES